MTVRAHRDLSRRERQIMDVIYARGRATAAEVMENLPDAPGYSAVRALLRKLETKGHVRHEQEGPRYVYLPTVAREQAGDGALRRMVRTFFDGSPARTAAALLEMAPGEMSEAELDRLAELIEDARGRGR